MFGSIYLETSRKSHPIQSPICHGHTWKPKKTSCMHNESLMVTIRVSPLAEIFRLLIPGPFLLPCTIKPGGRKIWPAVRMGHSPTAAPLSGGLGGLKNHSLKICAHASSTNKDKWNRLYNPWEHSQLRWLSKKPSSWTTGAKIKHSGLKLMGCEPEAVSTAMTLFLRHWNEISCLQWNQEYLSAIQH